MRFRAYPGGALLRLVGLALAVLAARITTAEQVTVSIKPDLVSGPRGCASTSGPGCGWRSAVSGDVISSLLHISSPCTDFSDPVPPHSKVTSIDLRFSYVRDSAPAVVEFTQFSSKGASFIGAFSRVDEQVQSSCREPYGQLTLETITGETYPDGIPTYTYGGRNYIGITSQASVSVEFLDIIINYKPPPKVEFDITSATDERERRVLIRQWRSDYRYFASAQAIVAPDSNGSRDGRIRIAGTLTDDGARVPDKTVYLRVVDPPDTAQYVPVAARRRGDNADRPGALEKASVTTDANGRFETVLTVTSFASGDNYQVEGSVIPGFLGQATCDKANACTQSGILTAWKRAVLEPARMFRRGSYVGVSAAAGALVVDVVDVSPFKEGDRVMLLKGPQNRVGPSIPEVDYARAEATIAAGGVQKSSTGAGQLILVSPLPFSMVGLDGRHGFPSVIADFVGVVESTAEKTFYETNVSYLEPLFADAFVEYVILPVEPVPLVRVLDDDGGGNLPNDEFFQFMTRWFRHLHLAGASHQFVFGSRESDMGSPVNSNAIGVTRAVGGISYSHVMVPKVLGVFATAASRRLLGEITAHEIAHQWRVNMLSSHSKGTTRGHCVYTYYDDPGKSCLMRSSYTSPESSSTLPEFYDDIVRFHYVTDATGVDSEYRWVRERCEPNPAMLISGTFDWWTVPATPCR